MCSIHHRFYSKPLSQQTLMLIISSSVANNYNVAVSVCVRCAMLNMKRVANSFSCNVSSMKEMVSVRSDEHSHIYFVFFFHSFFISFYFFFFFKLYIVSGEIYKIKQKKKNCNANARMKEMNVIRKII